MANKIQLRRGLKANIPTLDIGEPAFCTDTKEFYIGTKDGNARMSYDTSQGVVATDSDKLGGQLPSYYAKQSDIAYKTAGGTATALTLDTGTLVDGYSVTFIASANNNGAATKVNNKNLYKPNTTTAPNLTAGKAYTVWYNKSKDCFFIKASAEGTVTADKVLANETFSNDNDTGIKGTMPNNPLNTTADHSIVDSGILHLFIPFGAYLQPGTTDTNHSAVQIPEPNLISVNILKGKSIFGVAGGIDLSNLKPENVKKDVNINGTVGTLEEKFTIGDYFKNVSLSNIMSVKFIHNEGLYCVDYNSNINLIDTDGNIIKTINHIDLDTLINIDDDFIFWINHRDSSYAIRATNKNGVEQFSIAPPYGNKISSCCCCSLNKKNIYIFCNGVFYIYDMQSKSKINQLSANSYNIQTLIPLKNNDVIGIYDNNKIVYFDLINNKVISKLNIINPYFMFISNMFQ
ncbi:hypothetical protein [Clostridium tyrobutyricum]|uniref:hyaluronate lyase N-terminal domain-containing protein n=1 Tax=Clostridium tyrobutyricum TaxID=1519 RepID=UPI0020CBD4E0|nr:hypothetical protein [Clostridium tyrobutyricum]